ncbi:hypothetical protein [Thiosulfativibrio zosterae]|uniref:Uncharacterized protein n=1 Tax=Thiosulfativibrio zosterae TaxID=2675053 RepID=A0A6F8PPJ3_9GAMM|nr:hypothetical protein [Thiosulfativibrio zosterae]BBP43996.1 hypothetical protein THMIRHAT_17420 [Thiosulfativibrio zosterae]
MTKKMKGFLQEMIKNFLSKDKKHFDISFGLNSLKKEFINYLTNYS